MLFEVGLAITIAWF